MNLKIYVEQDKELRSYVKDLIKGQVISLMRGQFRDAINAIAQEEVDKYMKRIIGEKYAREVVQKALKDIVIPRTTGCNTNQYFASNHLKKMVQDIIRENMKGINW